MQHTLFSLLAFVMLTGCQAPFLRAQNDAYDSGGALMPEQAAYNVSFYDLDLRVQPADSSIQGTLTAHAQVVSPMAYFVLDLDPILAISAITNAENGGTSELLPFERKGGKVWIKLPTMKQPGESVAVAIQYGGRPRVAPNPPWEGGFTWARTPSGAPWIATTCQTIGADMWWPNKDHPSDEPDSMALHINVPEPLVVATNGHLQRIEDHNDATRTYHWFISTSINNYNVALNIAPYEIIEDTFESVAGDTFPVQFFVLPESVEQGRTLFPEILDHLRFYEETVGPYPFRDDKYGVAQTPHLGMEHQTIIAYGANFDNGAMTGGVDWGFDALHHHELAHEWWGNLVTNADWSDMWIHEGFGSYMQALYLEWSQGMDRYHAYMASIRANMSNQFPVAPREIRSTQQIYGGDIYFKGAWVLHTLRYLVGDEVFSEALQRMAYPTPASEAEPGCSACRFATTDDFLTLVESLSGMELDWFFEVYLRQPELPELRTHVDLEGRQMELEWVTPNDLPFSLPVTIRINNEVRRIEMPNGSATISLPESADVIEPDPESWILMGDS